MQLLSTPPPDRHTPLEDAQGLIVGAVMVALAVLMLRAGDLVTGQIAGLALVVSYPTAWPFGAVFFVLNLPFYGLAIRQLGWRFTIKTFAAVALMSALVEALALAVPLGAVPAPVAAVLFGVLAGSGLLTLFRHGATLGGVGIVALWLQDRGTMKAGQVQLIFDLGVFALALALFPWPVVLWSLVGAAILNTIITVNHRRDRYIARS
ncbi:MAG: YitT family protein [Rhodosalinus sp.]|uniref:YitT family protein n=1 Tax=Rhodosalinus sp. TaxID=2047741 RepID=UPI00397E3DB7